MKVIPFQIPTTGHEAFRLQVDKRPRLYDKLHQHRELQIMLIKKSEGTIVAGDYVGRFTSGDLFVIGSNQPHVFRNDERYFQSSRKESAIAVSLYFDEHYAGSTFWQLQEVKKIKSFLDRSGRGLRVMGATLVKATKLIQQLELDKEITRLITFLQLLKVLAESKETKPLSMAHLSSEYGLRESKRMNEILQFTFQESHRAIYLEEVAAVAHLSEEAFCRYFKTRTQKTYVNFLNEVRISKACQLIIETERSIQDIAFTVGFSNLSLFNRAFKKTTGVAPKKYLAR